MPAPFSKGNGGDNLIPSGRAAGGDFHQYQSQFLNQAAASIHVRETVRPEIAG